MKPSELIEGLRSRINPIYAAQQGTESYERRVCAEVLEAQAEEIIKLRDALKRLERACYRIAGLMTKGAYLASVEVLDMENALYELHEARKAARLIYWEIA